MVDVAKQFYGELVQRGRRMSTPAQLPTDADSKWSKLINCALDHTVPSVARTTALNLGYEAFFRGTKTIRENRNDFLCNIPWLIAIRPHFGLQYALRGMLGGRVRPQKQPQL